MIIFAYVALTWIILSIMTLGVFIMEAWGDSTFAFSFTDWIAVGMTNLGMWPFFLWEYIKDKLDEHQYRC